MYCLQIYTAAHLSKSYFHKLKYLSWIKINKISAPEIKNSIFWLNCFTYISLLHVFGGKMAVLSEVPAFLQDDPTSALDQINFQTFFSDLSLP